MAASNVSPQQNMREQHNKAFEKRLGKTEQADGSIDWLRMIRLYATPLMVVAVFAAIIFFLVLPLIGEIFGNLQEMNKLETDTQTQLARLEEVQTLADAQAEIQLNLDDIDKIIPEQVTQVVNFQRRIVRLARDQYGLNVTQSETGETILSSAVDSPDNPAAEALAIIEIPSLFSMVGPLDRIKGFVSAVQKSDDFIIIGQMELIAVTSDDTQPLQFSTQGDWRLDITLIKYQFPVANELNQLQQIYAQVPPTVKPNQKVLDFIRGKLQD